MSLYGRYKGIIERRSSIDVRGTINQSRRVITMRLDVQKTRILSTVLRVHALRVLAKE